MSGNDVLIYGKTKHEHDKNLHMVLEILGKNGFTLNKDKWLFFKKELAFFGIRFSLEGISLTDEKVKALTEDSAHWRQRSALKLCQN